jgi:hypothetical protein
MIVDQAPSEKFESARQGSPTVIVACVLSDIVKRRSFRANDHVKRPHEQSCRADRVRSARYSMSLFAKAFIHRPARTDDIMLAMLDRSAIGSILKKVGL